MATMQMKSTTIHRAPATSGTGVRRLPMAPGRVSQAPCRRAIAPRASRLEKSGFAKWSDSIGMPTEDGVFGFTPFAEMWVGRWAQLGFVSSIVVEFVTGKGTLQQIGLSSPSTPVFIALLVVFGGASVFGTARTIQRATNKKMSRSEINRYRDFLGLTKESEAVEDEAKAMKRRGDFTTPPNTRSDHASIASTQAAGFPVDSFLSTNEISEGAAEAQQMKAAVGTLTKDSETEAVAQQQAQARLAEEQAMRARQYAESMYFGEKGELAYARNIELTNGRWAMLGFLAAILVEASTGQGIIMQCISILKWSGLLGEQSGF